MITGCLDAELNDVPLSDCPENLGQLQKVILWHIFKADGTKNKFAPNDAGTPTDPALITNWTTFLAAADETKPVQSPFLDEPTSEAGAERTYGGGNATRNGVSINIGREPQTVEAKMLSQLLGNTTNPVKALKTFQKGSGTGKSSIGVILVFEDGRMLFDSNGVATDDASLELYPIPAHKLFISDRTLGGLEAPDHNMISWQFAPNWSDNLVVVTPTDFDALEDLENT
jgi:hypothetical protein